MGKMMEELQTRMDELEEEKKDLSVVDYSAKKAEHEANGGAQPKKKKAKAEGGAPVVTGADGRRKRLNPPHVAYSIRAWTSWRRRRRICRWSTTAQQQQARVDRAGQ